MIARVACGIKFFQTQFIFFILFLFLLLVTSFDRIVLFDGHLLETTIIIDVCRVST